MEDGKQDQGVWRTVEINRHELAKDDDSTLASLFTNIICFILGGALVWTLSAFAYVPFSKKAKAFSEETVFKQGVEWGVNGAIYCVNNGITNIPRDELIQRAWAVRRGEKK